MNIHVQDKPRKRSSNGGPPVATADMRSDYRRPAVRVYDEAKNAVISCYHAEAGKLSPAQAKMLAADLVAAFKLAAGDYS